MADYNEIICTAIDTIVTSRLEGLKYDITKVCRIEDDTDKDQGKYLVSEGQVFFTAYSSDKTLSKGSTVQVTIPNGDFNMQKTITGRISNDNTPYSYTSPLESMISFPEATYQNLSVFNICANGSNKEENDKKYIISPTMQLIHSIDSINGLSLTGFTRLGISADFSTLLKEKKVKSGTFGLAILIYCKNKEIPYRLDLSTSDMFGNIYSSGIYSNQEKIFNISKISESITNIKLYLFENGNFLNDKNEYISYDKNKIQNIFVKNIKIFFGYDKSECEGETLKLYTKDILNYRYDQPLERELSLRWIHEYEENNKKQFKILTDRDLGTDFFINWYQYIDDLDYTMEDKYGGNNWLKIASIKDNFSQNIDGQSLRQKIILNKDNQQESFKAVGLYKKGDNVSYVVSDIITFTNVIAQKNDKTKNVITDLQIICEDGYDGKYSFYNQNGNIKDQSKGLGYERKLKINYKDQDIFNYFKNKKIDYIEWLVPKNANQTMLVVDEKTLEQQGAIIDKNKYEDYYSILKYYNNDKDQGFISLSYYIKSFWQNTFSQNVIKCNLSVDGVIYESQKDFVFNRVNNNGTNYNFIIQYKDKGTNAINVDSSEPTIVEAILYDNNEQPIGLGENDKITWSWWKKSPSKMVDGKLQDYLWFNEELNGKIEIPLIYNELYRGKVPEDNYNILQATVEIYTATQDNILLTAYLPIAMKKGSYSYFSGAKEILYNSLGTPEYDTGPYILKDQNNNEVATTLKLVNSEITFENEEQVKDYYPTLKQYKERDYALSACPFYFKDIKNEVCVVATTLSEVAWSQPILIVQSTSGFTSLNSWDGTLTMDEENGIIMSSMIGAGRKNENGNFTGVLLGDLQTINDMAEPVLNTGVYGFNNNVIMYSLKDDGTATFGAKGRGQIRIDGNEGMITSGNWSEKPGEEQGMRIDFDNGFLEIKDKGKDRIYLGTGTAEGLNDNYLTVKSVNNNVLINISDKDYYLQSDGYNINMFNPIGTKINLSKGDIKVSSEKGFVNIQPQSPFLQVGTNSKTLLQMGAEEGYFLQSADFQEEISFVANNKQIYQIPDNLFNISGFKKEATYVYENKGSYYNAENNKILTKTFELTLEEKELLKKVNNITEEELPSDIISTAIIQKKEVFKNSLIPITSSKGQGMHINLEDGSIVGYNIYFKAIGPSSDGKNRSLIINSGAGINDYPLMIGSHFKVDWEGRLWCDNITIGAGDSSQSLNYAININNRFVVDHQGDGFWAGQKFSSSSSQASTFALNRNSNLIEEDELNSKILIYKDGDVQQSFTLQNLIDYIKEEIQKEGN